FDNDGIFSNSELIISSNGTSSYETHTATFTIPSSAVPCTLLRMRISSDYSSSPQPQPCSNPAYGQTEDFMVIINSVSPKASIAASPGTHLSSGDSVTFTATASHGGVNPQYEWRVNGIP